MSAPMSAEVFVAGLNDVLDDVTSRVRILLGEAPPDTVVVELATWFVRRINDGDLEARHAASMAASALVRLVDEQAAHAKTCDNFEAYAESTSEELARLRAEIDRLRAVAS